MTVESLEQRALLAVTATVSGDELQISLGAADDVAYLSNDGGNYVVRGTDLSGYIVGNAEVKSVTVVGTAAANQSFTVVAGVGAVLTNSLSVAASVESTQILGTIDTVGTVTIGSSLTTIAADITTTGKQDYQGDVGLIGTRTLSAGAADIAFGGKVDSSAMLFTDPDAFAAGTTLTNAFPGITLSDAGKLATGDVTSELSGVPTPTTGDYAPAGNRVFGNAADWNGDAHVFKAEFASSVTSVSLDFAPNDSFDPNAYLEAYDSSGRLIASANYAEGIPELSFVTLTVSAPNIASILASFDPGGGNAGLLDNLRATLATTPTASLTVNAAGATSFAGAVGGTAALASLKTDAGGTVSLKSVTTSGAQTYGDDTATLDGTYITTDSSFTVANAAVLAGDVAINTGTGNISFKDTLDGGKTLGLTAGKGNVTFTGLVGDTTPLGAVTVNSAANVTANGIRAASLAQVAGSGTTTLNGGAFTSAPALTEALRTTDAAGVSLTGTNLAVNGAITTTNAGTVAFNQTGTVTIAAAADIAADGKVGIKATGGIATAGDVTTTGDDVDFESRTTLSDNVTVNTGTGTGNISFKDTLDGGKTLGLTAGKGNVTFTGLVGDTTPLGAVTVNSAANVTANGIRAASLAQVAGSGTTTLNGGAFTSAPALTEALRTTDAAGVSLTGTNLAVNGAITTTNAGTVAFNQTGTVTIAAAADIAADGKVGIKATGGIATAGDVTTTGDDVDFESRTTLSDNVTVNTGTGTGNISFKDTLDGDKTLGLTAGKGSIFFKSTVGSTTPLAGLSLASAASTTADSSVKLAKAAASGQDGLTIAAGVNNVTMTAVGSSVTGFARDGIAFLGGSTNSRLSGFTVSGNGSNGVTFAAGSYTGTVITGNTIRDNGNTGTHVGNGILVEGSDLMIGWTAAAGETNLVANTITGNARNGIEIRGAAAQNNTILSNSIYLNGYVETGVPGKKTVVGEGIALSNGGNGGQAAPQILRMVADATDRVVRAQFIVPAAGSYYVQFFDNTPTDERNISPVDTHGFEGRTFAGDTPAQTGGTVTTGKPAIADVLVTGNALTTVEIPFGRLPSGSWLTATATLVTGTTATNTSPFSAAVQRLDAPVLAVGGDGQSTIWDREFTFSAVSSTKLQIGGLSAAQAAFFANGTRITVASVGSATTTSTAVTASSFTARTGRLTLTLQDAIPVAGGTVVLGSPSLPSARLVNASDITQTALWVTESAISTALVEAKVPGLTANQQAAFVTRFQGGLRVASGDFDGDGYTDLVTAPGGVPTKLQSSLRNVFGSAARVITIYSGNPGGAWTSASIDVGSVFGTNYLDGFHVMVGNVGTENTGSGNAVAELVVASTGKVAVFNVTVPSRGVQPTIDATPTKTQNVAGTITGLTTGSFTGSVTDLADIVVAATTATSRTLATSLNTTTVSVLKPAGGVSSFKVNSQVLNADPAKGGKLVNVFFNGASLAAGDIDNTIDQRPELVLGAGAGGLGNVRVLSADVVANANQAEVDAALGQGGRFSQPVRGVNSVTGRWQPSGGPDYFAGVQNVPTPLGSGLNAPLAVAVVESNGKDFRAEVYAALGTANQTPNQIRQLVWSGVNSWSGADWHSPDGGSRFRKGAGLRLG